MIHANQTNPFDFGAIGDGIADDTPALQATLDACYGTQANPNGSSDFPSGGHAGYYANKELWFPPGIFKITSPLVLPAVTGVHITGSGKMATKIINVATSGSTSSPSYGTVFYANAIGGANFQYIHIENMWLNAADPGSGTFNKCFEVSSGNTQVLLRNMRFEGGDGGIALGTILQTSEYTLIGCDFVNNPIGFIGYNFNALDYTFKGGSFQNCGKGIADNSTSPTSFVSGTSFSGSTVADFSGSTNQAVSLEAVTSTSPIMWDDAGPVKMKACTYTPGSPGQMARTCIATLDACRATNCVSQTAANESFIYIRGCSLPGGFVNVYSNTFVGGISGYILNASSVPTGHVFPGGLLSGAGVTSGTRVMCAAEIFQNAGVGNYYVNISQSVAAGTTFTISGLLENI
jgi:hypothetical protein